MTSIKIFIGSSNELKEERAGSVEEIVSLNKTYNDFRLEPVKYEMDSPSGNAPTYKNLQDSFNPLLKESEIAVFLFYSKVGEYTYEELQLALKWEKKVFVYFKKGFTPENPEEEKIYAQVTALRKKLNNKNMMRCLKYKGAEDYYGKLYRDLNLHIHKEYEKKARIIGPVSGKLLNKDFKKSLLSIDISKYLAYDRYYNTRIWIGSPDIVINLNEVEDKFCEITQDKYGDRTWRKKDITAAVNERKPQKEAELIIIKSKEDYKLLLANLTEIVSRPDIILCFYSENICPSKIYANDLRNRLAAMNRFAPVLIEDDIELKTIAGNSLSFCGLVDMVYEFAKPAIRACLDPFYKKDLRDDGLLVRADSLAIDDAGKNSRHCLYNILCRLGDHHHREQLVNSLQHIARPGLLFEYIKDDLFSLNSFLNRATNSQLQEVMQENKRHLLLLLVAKEKQGEQGSEIIQLLNQHGIAGNPKVMAITNPKHDDSPRNATDLWIRKELYPGKYAQSLTREAYSRLGTEMKYVFLATEPHTDEMLKMILEHEELKLGFRIVNRADCSPVVMEKFKIEENLFVYEI